MVKFKKYHYFVTRCTNYAETTKLHNAQTHVLVGKIMNWRCMKLTAKTFFSFFLVKRAGKNSFGISILSTGAEFFNLNYEIDNLQYFADVLISEEIKTFEGRNWIVFLQERRF